MSNYENDITRRQMVKAIGGLTIVGAAVAGQPATADDKAGNSSNNPDDEIGPCVGTDHEDCPT